MTSTRKLLCASAALIAGLGNAWAAGFAPLSGEQPYLFDRAPVSSMSRSEVQMQARLDQPLAGNLPAPVAAQAAMESRAEVQAQAVQSPPLAGEQTVVTTKPADPPHRLGMR